MRLKTSEQGCNGRWRYEKTKEMNGGGTLITRCLAIYLTLQ